MALFFQLRLVKCCMKSFFLKRESFHPTAFFGILGPFPDLDFLVARCEHFCDEVLHNQTASLKGCRLYMGLAEFSCNLVRIWRLFCRHNDTKPSWNTYVRRFGHPQWNTDRNDLSTWNLVILHDTSWYFMMAMDSRHHILQPATAAFLPASISRYWRLHPTMMKGRQGVDALVLQVVLSRVKLVAW